jgi:hypothetical protein
MHIVKVNGGLGNQMFQYGFALALDRLYGNVKLDLGWIKDENAHNGYELDRHFRLRLAACSAEEREALGDIDPSFIGKVRRRLGIRKRSHYVEPGLGWDPYYLSVGRDSYFSGYWQSYRYFEGIEDSIRSAFEFIEPLSERNKSFLDGAKGRTLIGIHVRHGDYLSGSFFSKVCGADYYRSAMALAAEGARDPLFAFFSDDLDWCRDNLAVEGEACFVDWNRGNESYADMRLMTRCDALVIANSSFSWWGAWLGDRPGRGVYAPLKWWFGGIKPDNPDIAPPAWKRLEVD